MTTSTHTPTAPDLYCPWHHGPATADCPVLRHPSVFVPEIADALDTLRDLAIDPHLVDERHTLPLSECGGCDDADWPRSTAVARVSYTAGNGVRYGEDACPLCLGPLVEFWRKNATAVEVYLPIPAGSWGSVVPGVVYA